LGLLSQRQTRRIQKFVYDIEERKKNSSVKDGNEICVVTTELGLPVLNPMVNGRMPQGLSFSSRSVENIVFYFPRHSSHHYYTTIRKTRCNYTSKRILLQTLRCAYVFLIKLLPKIHMCNFLIETFPYRRKIKYIISILPHKLNEQTVDERSSELPFYVTVKPS
jgi:hypothetical protein